MLNKNKKLHIFFINFNKLMQLLINCDIFLTLGEFIMEKEVNLQQEIDLIKERNSRVELDKKWETSWTRRLCICFLTYFVVVLYTFIISKVSNIWLSSLVPVIGFTLSTLSLKFVRKLWEKSLKNK